MRDGILIINKPQNWTSHDCVAVCRRALGIKKVGHGGTLDPMAEGLLPVFVGKATRIMEYLDLDDKTYRCTAKLGMVTDTQDIWGETLETHGLESITEDAVVTALKQFQGDIQQIPPMYSALKVNGRKLYEYARNHIPVEVKPRAATIHRLRVERIDLQNREVSFEVTCSKGTYIRSICHDLGKILGCGAAMSALTRTGSGVFQLDERAVSPQALKEMEPLEIESLLLPVDEPLVQLGVLEMNADRANYFCRGNSIRWGQVQKKSHPLAAKGLHNGRGIDYSNMYRVYQTETGEFLGTGYYDRKNGLLKADKIFVTRQQG